MGFLTINTVFVGFFFLALSKSYTGIKHHGLLICLARLHESDSLNAHHLAT